MELIEEEMSESRWTERKWNETFSGQVECCRIDRTAAIVPRM